MKLLPFLQCISHGNVPQQQVKMIQVSVAHCLRNNNTDFNITRVFLKVECCMSRQHFYPYQSVIVHCQIVTQTIQAWNSLPLRYACSEQFDKNLNQASTFILYLHHDMQPSSVKLNAACCVGKLASAHNSSTQAMNSWEHCLSLA